MNGAGKCKRQILKTVLSNHYGFVSLSNEAVSTYSLSQFAHAHHSLLMPITEGFSPNIHLSVSFEYLLERCTVLRRQLSCKFVQKMASFFF